MTVISPFETHTAEYEAWFEKYPYVYQTELNAIRSQMQELPEDLIGIEVGVGTGRYAMELGIKEGVEPSENMRMIALDRGIEVMDARAERLPYKDISFDFVLFVTICHFDDMHKALKEAYRVLKPEGSLIIGFIDRHSQVGQQYEKNKKRSTFYRQAHFYSVEDVKDLLKEARFKDLVFTQTIFGEIEKIKDVQLPQEGYGEGSFVVVRASK